MHSHQRSASEKLSLKCKHKARFRHKLSRSQLASVQEGYWQCCCVSGNIEGQFDIFEPRLHAIAEFVKPVSCLRNSFPMPAPREEGRLWLHAAPRNGACLKSDPWFVCKTCTDLRDTMLSQGARSESR